MRNTGRGVTKKSAISCSHCLPYLTLNLHKVSGGQLNWMEKVLFFPKYFSPGLKMITARLSTTEEEFHIFLVAWKYKTFHKMLCSHCFVKKNYKSNIPDFRTWYPDKGYTGLSVIHYTSKTISIIFYPCFTPKKYFSTNVFHYCSTNSFSYSSVFRPSCS